MTCNGQTVKPNTFCQIYVPLLDIPQWLERHIVQTDAEVEQRLAAEGGIHPLMVVEEERGDHSLKEAQHCFLHRRCEAGPLRTS